MPLFQTKEWWSVRCGTSERFDAGCLAVDALVNGDSTQLVAVGSHEGVLRVFRPALPVDSSTKTSSSGESAQISSGSAGRGVCVFSPDHLLLETTLETPILALLTGKFLSGSGVVCLLVLAPSAVTVYTLDNVGASSKSRSGQFRLTAVYSHQLANSAYSVFCKQPTDKASDKVKTRGVGSRLKRHLGCEDGWYCVLSLDCTLSFYERENIAFTCSLPDVILPAPIIYLPASDVILISSSSYTLEAYKFSSLARLGESQAAANSDSSTANSSSSPLYCEWIYNIGEYVLDIQHVVAKGQSTVIVLCQCSLFCLSENGTLISCLMLDYTPACMTNFTNEKGSLISVVCSLSGSLYIYSGNFLRWTARCADAALGGVDQSAASSDDVTTPNESIRCVQRACLCGISGLFLLLTSAGALSANYLGTAPVVFVAGASKLSTRDESDAHPVVAAEMVDYERFDGEMARLNVIIDQSLASKSVDRARKPAGGRQALRVVAVVDSKSISAETNDQTRSVLVNVAVTCDFPADDVHVVFHVDKPLSASPPYIKITHLEAANTRSFTTSVSLVPSSPLQTPPDSLHLHVTVTCHNADRLSRVAMFSTRSRCRLPLSLVMYCSNSTVMTSDGSSADLPLVGVSDAAEDLQQHHCVVIGSRRPLLDVRQLFDDMWRGSSECDASSVVFRYRGTVPTAAAATDAEKGFAVRVRADSKLQSYCVEAGDIHALWLVLAELLMLLEKLYGDRHSIFLHSSLPLSELHAASRAHLESRLSRAHHLHQLDELARQLRAVQRRLFSRYKQLQSATPLIQMERLLNDTYHRMVQAADAVTAATDRLRSCSRRLAGCCRLIQLLASLPHQQQQGGRMGESCVGGGGRDGGGGRMLAKVLYSVLGWRCEPTESDEQGWLERVYTAADYISTTLTSSADVSADSPLSVKSTPGATSLPPGENVVETGEFVPGDCTELLQRHLCRFMETVAAVNSPQMEALFADRATNDSPSKSSALQAMSSRPASSRFTRSARQRKVNEPFSVNDPEQAGSRLKPRGKQSTSPENLIDDDDSSEEI